jgi:hypothetical protein
MNWTGKNNPRWNGGRKTHGHGYILVASPDHPYRDKQGYVREHRLVVESRVGRYLRPEEDVHHLDNNKKNNAIDNLELFPDRASHLRKYHQTGGETGWFQKGQVPHNKYLEPRSCLYCAKPFQPADATRKFCGYPCYWQSKKRPITQEI